MNNEQVQEIFVEDIIPNRFQPRLTFDEKALQELSDSIKVHGVIQPLVLRKVGNKYEIIAGERRYKASCMAGLKKVPAIVRELTDNESAEIALIENIQRKNLSSIEEAQSYKNLLQRGYITQDELAKKLGVSQPTIANKLRLLNLCDEVQNALLNEQISERHARSLLQIANPDDQKKMLNRIVKERLTVKQLDNEIKKMSQGGAATLSAAESSTGGARVEMNNMNEMDTTVGGQNQATKNLFGFAMEPPTDLETSAPNLTIGEEEFVPPVSFNPFTGEQVGTPQQDANQITPMDPSLNTQVSEPETIETFDMFGDIVPPNTTPLNQNMDSMFGGSGATVETQDSSKNIGDQINSIRGAVRGAEQNGFRVEMEEYDFDDMYQIVVKIKKDK